MNETQHELPILVTGAAGRIGSVGRIVTELLLAQAITVKELCTRYLEDLRNGLVLGKRGRPKARRSPPMSEA